MNQSYKKGDLTGKALTVQGPINPEQLGKVICHEHLLIDFRVVLQDPPDKKDLPLKNEKINLENLGWIRTFWNCNEDNLLIDDIDISRKEIMDFSTSGGGTIVDVTSTGLHRQPEKLKLLSQDTKVNIIMGSGYYVDSSLPNYFETETADMISKRIINDIFVGVESSKIHSGIIGEIGCSYPLTKNERKSLEAAVIAQNATGAPLLIHPGRHETSPIEIIKFIEKVGADLSNTVMGHIERTVFQLDTLEQLANKEVYLNFDLFGHESSFYPLAPKSFMPSDHQRIEIINHLIGWGYVEKVLLGHDICSKHRLKKYGGHGWDHILRRVLPRMIDSGISPNQINDMITENPKRLLTFK
ncbi:MAG: hypothetical protein VX359_01420 [Chloroflexota bacterium]